MENLMTAGTIQNDILSLRTDFREALYEGLGFSKYAEVIRKGLSKCSGEFEEQTLRENLQEEFQEFLEATMEVEKEAI